MKGRRRRKRTPQMFGALTNIHYKFREDGGGDWRKSQNDERGSVR